VSRYGANDELVTVTVIEGRVAVAPLTDIHLTPSLPKPHVDIVNAGERLRVQPHTSPVVKAAAIDEATAWLNGQLIFDSTPLGEAASQFNRYNRAKIEVTAPELSRIPVGGVFRIGDSRSFARTVAESHHLKLIVSGENLLLEPESPAPNSTPLQ
jgi:transmembrane sensor